MKKFYAWLLLSVSTFQWIGGHICFEVSYFIEVVHQMDEVEKEIAKEVKEEIGVEANVKILQEEDIMPRGHIYSDFFAFSKNLGDQTVFYTIEDDSSGLSYEQVTERQQPQQDQEKQASLIKSLYQDFTFPTQIFSVASPESFVISNFQLKEHLSSFHPTILCPPPDFA